MDTNSGSTGGAVRRTPVVTFGILLAGLWTLLVALSVFNAVQWGELFAAPTYVGTAAISGIVGLVVMAVTLGLLVVLYGEVSSDGSTPSTWPPRE